MALRRIPLLLAGRCVAMALIFRSIVEVEAPDFLAATPTMFRDWLRWKLRTADLEVHTSGEPQTIAGGHEIAAVDAASSSASAFRGHLYERRDGEEVKTTLTVIESEQRTWAWVDLERWAEDAWQASWVPFSPGIVGSVLRAGPCSRGPTKLSVKYQLVEADGGEHVAGQVQDLARELPIVVVTPTARELDLELKSARDRATELQKRLAGVAPVYLLGKGAITAFSRAMLDAGDQMDVHSGAVRTYLPGAGDERDVPWRHRYVPFHRLDRRPADMAARLVSVPLMRAASHQAPPAAWRTLRALPEFATGHAADSELAELVDLAEDELLVARTSLAEADARANEAESGLELERETQSELLAEREDLVRRLRYAETALRERGESPEPPSGDAPFIPDFCQDVVDHVAERFDRLVLGPRVREGAEQLDEHAESAWARKGLRALDALQQYAEARASGTQCSFWAFCEGASSASLVPTSWLSMKESETTDQNSRFRGLRTFEVDEMVAPSGSIYMPAHIKLEKGGSPSPRIHFHDDTDGATGKIHVGWFGPHRNNKSTN